VAFARKTTTSEPAGEPALPSELPGAIVRGFIAELYEATEHGPPDPEIAIPEAVGLLELKPQLER